MEHQKLEDGSTKGPVRTSRRKWLIIGGIIMLVLAIALGVGLGVGLTEGRRHRPDYSQDPSAPTSTAPVPSPNVSSAGLWQPQVGATWNLDLAHAPSSPDTQGYSVWDIDLFDTDKSVIDGLHTAGSDVICYFSAGSYENWRPDASKFQDSDLGKGLDGWEGENWLNINSQNVRSIMSARMDLAVQKGCKGVDPDNVDGYNNDNGLGLTSADSVNYLQFLAAAAQARNLSIGLKNAGDIVLDVINLMQWSVNEECLANDECQTFQPFIQQGKPVFHVEYPKGNSNTNTFVATNTKNEICDGANTKGFSTIIKNMNLDTWIETCPVTTQ